MCVCVCVCLCVRLSSLLFSSSAFTSCSIELKQFFFLPRHIYCILCIFHFFLPQLLIHSSQKPLVSCLPQLSTFGGLLWQPVHSLSLSRSVSSSPSLSLFSLYLSISLSHFSRPPHVHVIHPFQQKSDTSSHSKSNSLPPPLLLNLLFSAW